MPTTPPSFQRLRAHPGIGAARAARILAALALPYALQRERGSTSVTTEHIVAAVADYSHAPQEHIVVFAINGRGMLLERFLVSVGTVTSALVHPREVFRPVLAANAVGCILVHTHPSGNPQPSKQDWVMTDYLRKAGFLLGIELIDHIIVAKNAWYSLREQEAARFQDSGRVVV
jgi:DNA repair protein RadC